MPMEKSRDAGLLSGRGRGVFSVGRLADGRCVCDALSNRARLRLHVADSLGNVGMMCVNLRHWDYDLAPGLWQAQLQLTGTVEVQSWVVE